MPELPEVESVRRSLEPVLLGRTVVRVQVRRADIVTLGSGAPALNDALLLHRTIVRLDRHGKQLALIGRCGGQERTESALCVHLGMTGSLRHFGASAVPGDGVVDAHTHILWQLDDGSCFRFRDPRRFGGLWAFSSCGDLADDRWSRLGPDALTVRPGDLFERLQRTARPIKAVLLDQTVIAGLGNIYVDESLFAAGIHPLRRADRLSLADVAGLVEQFQAILERAIASGGSTLRDYADGAGRSGSFQFVHQVYGHAGQPCPRCGRKLARMQAGGRTTVFCAGCQPRRAGTGRGTSKVR